MSEPDRVCLGLVNVPWLGAEVRVWDGPFGLDVWIHCPTDRLLMPWGSVQLLNLSLFLPLPTTLPLESAA